MQTISPEQGARLMRAATTASSLVALTLILAKAVVWQWSGSVSLLASLVDSVMDGVASLMTLLAVRYSLVPPDDEHRFGHGSAEALAGLAQALFIGASAVFLFTEGLQRLRAPSPPEATGWAVAVMGLSIVLTVALVSFQRYVVKRTGSTAVAGDSLHYLSDLATNVAIIVAILVAGAGWVWFDAGVALVIAVMIFLSALKLGYDAVQLLLDRELPSDIRQRIEALLRESEGVLGLHDLRTRQSGRVYFVQAHVELDRQLSFEQAHDYIRAAGDRVRAAFPGAEVLIHGDPVTAAP